MTMQSDPSVTDADGGERVALQYFDYKHPGGPVGDHWQRVADAADAIAETGYDAVWVQPPTAPVTEVSNGYNPADHLTWESQLGDEDDFAEMVTALEQTPNGPVGVYVDAIVNHTGTEPPGEGVYEHLDDPDMYHDKSAPGRTTFQLHGLWDLDQTHDAVSDHLYDFVAKIDDMGCAGIRWDAAKHVPRWFFEDYLNEWAIDRDLFRVGEVYDGDVGFVQSYTDTGMHCFDYPLFYALQDVCRPDGDFRALQAAIEDGNSLVGVTPERASTFVANHDEGAPPLERLAYAFVLTAPGYPMVYSNACLDDAGVQFDAPWLADLVAVKTKIAEGEQFIRYADRDLFVHERDGSLLAGLNKATTPRTVEVQTSWTETTLRNHTGADSEIRTDASGTVTLTVPPEGWVCYVPC